MTIALIKNNTIANCYQKQVPKPVMVPVMKSVPYPVPKPYHKIIPVMKEVPYIVKKHVPVL